MITCEILTNTRPYTSSDDTFQTTYFGRFWVCVVWLIFRPFRRHLWSISRMSAMLPSYFWMLLNLSVICKISDGIYMQCKKATFSNFMVIRQTTYKSCLWKNVKSTFNPLFIYFVQQHINVVWNNHKSLIYTSILNP